MKKTPLFVASAVGLTLIFYMAAYYLLPGDPPTAAMVGLFAAAALGIVWTWNALWSRKHASKAKPPVPSVRPVALWVAAGLIGFGHWTSSLMAQTRAASTALTIDCFASPQTVFPGGSADILAVAVNPQNRPLRYSYSATFGRISSNTSMATLFTVGAPTGALAVVCNVSDDQGQSASTTTVVSVTEVASAPQRPPSVGSGAPPPSAGGGIPATPVYRGVLPRSGGGSRSPSPVGGSGPPALDRVTGTAVLLAGQKEPPGYGLYSYALLFHTPSAAELPRYQAFLKALVDLPTAQGLAQYVTPSRINLTSIPLTTVDLTWEPDGVDAKVAFILNHYDYARSAAMRASLTTRIGTGPVLLSVLSPINPAEQPSPVLVQDMSLAQPTLMSAYVQSFVSQAAQQRFWQESALSQFGLGLRNSLETAAAGLNLSQTAVDGWIKFLK